MGGEFSFVNSIFVARGWVRHMLNMSVIGVWIGFLGNLTTQNYVFTLTNAEVDSAVWEF